MEGTASCWNLNNEVIEDKSFSRDRAGQTGRPQWVIGEINTLWDTLKKQSTAMSIENKPKQSYNTMCL